MFSFASVEAEGRVLVKASVQLQLPGWAYYGARSAGRWASSGLLPAPQTWAASFLRYGVAPLACPVVLGLGVGTALLQLRERAESKRAALVRGGDIDFLLRSVAVSLLGCLVVLGPKSLLAPTIVASAAYFAGKLAGLWSI